MLAAIILRGEKAWFFKMAGPKEAMSDKADAFKEFVRSVRFDADKSPKWKLASGWVEKPGNSLRHATIEVGTAAAPLELTVTVLSKAEDDSSYVLANVNRWREQLGLSPATAAEVKELATLPLEDSSKATIVDLVGNATSSAGNLMSAAHAGLKSPQGHFSSPSKVVVRVDTPAGWTPQALRGSRRAAFTVQDGEDSAEITVQSFPAAAPLIADPLANFNRWRSELGLDPATAAELDRASKKMTISGQPAVYLEITSPSEQKQKAILAALFKFGEEMWFIKLFGSQALAQREREKFSKFCESLNLTQDAKKNGN
jgi:hypothetical protein